MRIIRAIAVVSMILCPATFTYSQAILNADGPGNTYELITGVFAPGHDTSAVEDPQCIHPAFGRHIAEVFDTDLNQYVFEYYIHVTPDNDRCINFDRQRVEIKTYDQSPDSLKGIVGETVTYKWKFRLPVGFQPSPNFTHIHQIKAVGGNESDPIFTLTCRKGTPNKLELIHKDTTKVAIVNLSAFEGVWVECTEIVYIHPTSGSYSMLIKRVSDGTVLLSYSNPALGTIRLDNDFVRPKWGIYRSLLSSSNLRDETIRFNSFSIKETTPPSSSVTTSGSGNWSSTTPGAPWPGGIVPASGADVLIADTCVVTLDQDAVVTNLTVGQGASGTLQTSKTVLTNLTVTGNLTVNAGASFKAQSATTSFAGPHTLTIQGNILNNGAVFDLRTGTAGSTLGVINVTFAGTTNSAVTMNPAYSSTNGDFNAVTINKVGAGKVILGSDMYINGGSSTGSATMNSILTFANGLVETGSFALIAQTSTAANVTGASSASYVIGAMGRGMSNSGGSSKDFPVGDVNGYRPLNLRSTTAGSATGHFATVRMISGDANTGTSVLNGGIDRVSAVRYYKISYTSGGGAATMSFDRFYPSYGADDAVVPGNTNLRVAYSTDNRGTWTKLGQNSNPHTTDLTSPPTQIKPDSVNPAIVFTSGATAAYIALADTLGENPLPVQLSSFSATSSGNGSVVLRWTTISEVDNYGFYLQKRRTAETEWNELASSFIPGHGTTNEPQAYGFIDNTALNGTWQYRLRQVDLDGAIHFTEPVQVDVLTGVTEVVPMEFSLLQNYPNPFNPETSIKFSVDLLEHTTLKVYNALGQEVATLFDAVAEPGHYYDVKFAGASLASGVYLYRLQSGKQSEIRKLLLLR